MKTKEIVREKLENYRASHKPSSRAILGERMQDEFGSATLPPSAKQLEAAEAWSRQFRAPIAAGNVEAAAAVLHRWSRSLVESKLGDHGVDTSLAEIGIDVRTCGILEDGLGVYTLRDLLEQSRDEIVALPNSGYEIMFKIYERIIGWFIEQVAA